MLNIKQIRINGCNSLELHSHPIINILSVSDSLELLVEPWISAYGVHTLMGTNSANVLSGSCVCPQRQRVQKGVMA